MVGLDIQPHAILLMQLKLVRKKFQALQMATVALPSSVFVDGKIKQFEIIADLLKEQVIKMKLGGMAVAIQIPLNLVREQTMQVPSGLTTHAICEEIKLQIEKDFPGLNDALAIDFSTEKIEPS